jgi:hypothetical protein
MSGAILNEIYPNMLTFNVNKEDIPFNSDYKIPAEGVKIDQISFHYQVIAFFADFRIYDRFIQGNFGTVISSSSAAEHLIIYYALNGNNACIQSDYLTTSDKIQVDCVPDYNIYVDSSRKCVDNTYYFDTQFESENIPCAACDGTCVTKCFRGGKQECTCDMADGLYWLRKHETSYKTYCEYLPYIDFSAIQDIQMYVPSSATYESTLEVWFFAYSYNFNTFNFKKMTINWDLHNKIEVYGCKKIKGKHISIIEWNAFSIYAVQNQFIINSFLEKHKPDFILLNELGIKGNNKLNLHDNYNIIEK